MKPLISRHAWIYRMRRYVNGKSSLMRLWICGVAVLCTWFVGAACAQTGADANASEGLVVVGDSALGELPEGLLNAYESHANTRDVTYQQLGRSELLAAIESGNADAAFVLYPAAESAVFTTAVGYQPLVVVTGEDITVDGFSEGDVRAIFSGRKANWTDVGGPDLPIGPVLPFASSSERVAFEALIMRKEHVSLSSLMAGQPSQLVILVRGATGRIGLISGKVIPQGLKAMAINGEVVPINSTPRSNYPLIATIAFMSATEPGGEAKALLDWILSDDGQRIVENYALRVN